MKLILTILLTALFSGFARAQDLSTAKPAARAAIEGLVTRDPDAQPVKKALIELIAENQSEGGVYTAVTDPDGSFRIENILPGRYHLFAERPGLLASGTQRTDGRNLTLSAGQQLKDLHLRLQAAAVVRGRVTDEDGDPLPNAEVTVLRPTYVRGHIHWEQAGAERTNDLGEYRIANLSAGNAYVSVSPPPDIRALIETEGPSTDARPPAAEKPAPPSYHTTYYPGTTDRSQAAPIQLEAGDDFPVNFSLTLSPSLSIRGAVVNLPPRSLATIALQSRDFNFMNGAEVRKDGSFIIRDVSPGNYVILASVEGAAVPLTARQTLQVGSSNVEGLRLSPQPGATIHGRLRFESNGSTARLDPDRVFLSLQSADGEEAEGSVLLKSSSTDLAHVAPDGSFHWEEVPPGSYCVQLFGDAGASADWYVKAMLVGGRDVSDSGVSVNGSAVAIDLIASSNGGIVDGVVLNHKGEPVSDAVVVAAPEARLRSRVDRYGKTTADQSGHFILRGLHPGDYAVFAWEAVDGEAYYNPDFLKPFERQGTAVKLNEQERTSVSLISIPASHDLAGN